MSDELKHHEFCPLSSRKDGQPSCNEQSATITETGIMDFTIQNNNATANFPANSLYYRGQSRQHPLVAGAPGRTTRYDINLSFGHGNTTNMQQDLSYGGKELTAALALQLALQNLWTFTQGTGAAIHAAVIANIAAAVAAGTTPNGYFDLFYRLSYNTPAIRAEFQACMYRILFKNTGDLFQEINAVCRNGGYINNAANPIVYDDGTPANNTIIRWNTAGPPADIGNAKRLFLAQDQPSACRFIFLKKYGIPAETNSKAFGGFWGQEKKMIYYYSGINNPIYAGGGNTSQIKQNKINRQTKKKRLIRRTKKRLIIRKKQRQTKKR